MTWLNWLAAIGISLIVAYVLTAIVVLVNAWYKVINR